MKRAMQRLVTGAAACLLAVSAMMLPHTAASAGPECMFIRYPGLGAGASCPEPITGGGTGTSSSVPTTDDRMNSTPTGWWTYQNVDPDTVSALLSSNDARPTDLRVLSASPLRFSVTMVRNTGAYASGYWWYYGVTMTQVSNLLSTNNARLISAVRYGSVYAVVMVPNIGANAKAWGWCDTDFAGIGSCLGTTMRLTNIVSYAQNRFVVIFVNNSPGYGWCWYAGISRAALNNVCNGQSVLDISANPDGTFNVASVALDGDGRVHSFTSPQALVNYAVASPPDRPLFVTPYVANGTTNWITSFRYNS
ncbi:hypothetical protein [Micromonospora eburnea]|uniref:Peptidase inhibitor family I36 n=1 Tax=Micromonospora eburnea TaxID=227316 RepID=A0A1C6V2T7_9ACTN|nr:hypothetical protein [Micromonospora eburnea]SCL60210.1 hypothetical protein GA0070604_4244 [Micromonospora eburnea]